MHHPAFLSALKLVVALGWLCACSRPPTLLVTVNQVPPGAASLAVFIAKQGDTGDFVSPQEDLHPYDLSTPVSPQVSFVLRLPEATAAQLTLSVAAFSQPGGSGCVLRSSATGLAFLPSLLDNSVTVELGADAGDAGCQGVPRIVSASPALLHASGGDTLTIKGWGFRPGSRVMLDGVALTTTYRSAAVLEAAVPPAVHFGPVPLAVTVPGQTELAYSGLRYVADAVAFTSLGPVPSAAALRGIQVADLDRDGRPDLVSLPQSYSGTDITILFQTKPLSFTSQTITVAARMVDLAVVDLDKDGDLDLVTASNADRTLRVLRNNGAGVFTPETQLLLFLPTALAAADLSGDGTPEIILTDGARTTVYTLPNDGTGHFGTPTATTLAKVLTPTSLSTLDYDLDGRVDLVMDSIDFAPNPPIYNAGILMNQGSGLPATDAGVLLLSFPEYPSLPFLTTDIDGDNRDDLLASASAEAFHLFPSTSKPARIDQKFAPSCASSVSGSADLNGDGRGDLLVACIGGLRLEFMIQSAERSFASIGQAPALAIPGTTSSFFLNAHGVDLTGDGLPEVLVQNNTNYFIYKNTSR